MYTYNNIVKDGNEVLRTKCVDVTLPISDEDFETLSKMNDYLVNSYDDEACKKYNLRPGVGLAAPQVGVAKKMLCIMAYDEKGDFHHYVLVNPKVVSTSVEMTYLDSGEGCLSVTEPHKGYIHRHKRIKVKTLMYDFKKDSLVETTLNLKGYIAIVFQHEFDHLNGKLFYDHINKSNPFYVPENSSPVIFSNEE